MFSQKEVHIAMGTRAIVMLAAGKTQDIHTAGLPMFGTLFIA